jgi:hypothetical protein
LANFESTWCAGARGTVDSGTISPT